MFRVAICEDDKYQIDIYKELINKWGTHNKVAVRIHSFLSAEEFIIKNENTLMYDCILIDVKLKRMDGLELAKIIRENNNKVSIIFISGFEEYIGYGYDVAAIHYLLKPLKEEKFFQCLDKVLNKTSNYKKETNAITVKRFGNIINLKLNDILYCESYKHYVEINTEKDKIIIKKKISDLEEELDERLFVRTHKSYIVNISKTKEIKKNNIILVNDIEIPISKMRKAVVREKYVNYF